MTPLILAALLAQAAPDPAVAGLGRPVAGPLVEAAGKDAKALVIAFAGPDCPVSKLNKPKWDRISAELGAKGVRVLVVSSTDPAWTALLKPASTTECFVLDPGLVLRYRGALDDQYGIGTQKAGPAAHYLLDAVDAVLAGRAPSPALTASPGCEVEGPRAAAGPVTFHKDVLPVFHKRCVECHRPGEIGPFSLLDYAKAKANAKTILREVDAGRMPPWHADPKHGTWKNDRRLTDAERSVIARWVNGGAPEGSPRDAPPPPAFATGWRIGTPDAVYRLNRAEKVPAEGTIPYRHQIVPTKLEQDTWIQAIEIRPGEPKVVHHVLVFVQYPLSRLKEQPRIDGGLFNGYFGIMVPGESPMVFPEGMAKFLPAGALLVFQLHYTANGQAAEDRTQIGLKFAPGKPRTEVTTRGIVNEKIRIPPNAAAHVEQAMFTFPHDARILSFLPHMHVRGKSFRYELLMPDGSAEILLDVPRYDFNWQTCYRLAEPRLVPKGARIRATAVYDNSKANAANPDPSKEVRFGQQSWEEMLIGYVDFVKAD